LGVVVVVVPPAAVGEEVDVVLREAVPPVKLDAPAVAAAAVDARRIAASRAHVALKLNSKAAPARVGTRKTTSFVGLRG
jgi:hypothetical protein